LSSSVGSKNFRKKIPEVKLRKVSSRTRVEHVAEREHGSRRLTDPETLKGLAHPLRRKLYDQLAHFGPSTVTTLADRLDADPGQTSYHLRELGKRGFIEEAPEYARDRRERWWRVVPGTVSWSDTSPEQPAWQAVADIVFQQMIADQYERLVSYKASQGSWPAEWLDAVMSSNTNLRLRPDELKAMTSEVLEVLRRWSEVAERHPALHPDEQPDDGREHVYFFFHAVPERP
jgi:DNA-binding transcriptional ArsR family regulator